MTKKIIIAVTIVLVLLTGYLYFQNTKTHVNVASTSGVKVLISGELNPNDAEAFRTNSPLIFKSPSASITASFRGVTNQARNPGSTLFINDTRIGNVEGMGTLESSFSPDNKYFSVRTLSVCGVGCINSMLYVADILNSKLIAITPPYTSKDYKGDTSQYVDRVAEPFMESWSWDGSDLKIKIFFVGTSKSDGKTYRISNKEIWKYDLVNKKYTLLQVVEE